MYLKTRINLHTIPSAAITTRQADIYTYDAISALFLAIFFYSYGFVYVSVIRFFTQTANTTHIYSYFTTLVIIYRKNPGHSINAEEKMEFIEILSNEVNWLRTPSGNQSNSYGPKFGSLFEYLFYAERSMITSQ